MQAVGVPLIHFRRCIIFCHLCEMLKPLARLLLGIIPQAFKLIKKKRMDNMEWHLARDEMWTDVIQILSDRRLEQQKSGQSREARETLRMIKYLKKNKPGAQIRDAVEMRGRGSASSADK